MARTDVHMHVKFLPNYDAYWDAGIGDEQPLWDEEEARRHFSRYRSAGRNVRHATKRARRDRSFALNWDAYVNPKKGGPIYD